MNSLKSIIKDRKMILRLAKNDFKNKFAGSYFGLIWAFAQPVVIVSIYWIVFEKGLRSRPLPEMPDFPYLLWLIAGMCPWFFLNDAMNTSTNCLIEYGYIVKKMKFNIDIIPLIKIVSAAFVHCFFIVLVLAIYIVYGKIPTPYAFQMIYYSIGVFCFSVALVYLTSAINVFFRDIEYIWTVVSMLIMYASAIFYTTERVINTGNGWVFNINPLYMCIANFRNAVLYGKPMDMSYCIHSAIFAIVSVIVGSVLFYKKQDKFILYV